MPPTYSLPTGGAAVDAFYGARSELVDLAWLEVRPTDCVLDVGCGAGELTRRVAARLPSGVMVGLDTLPRATTGGAYVVADAHQLPVRDGVFDVTYCHTLLMHLSSPLGGLREMRRVTKAGGRVVALSEGAWARTSTAPLCGAIEELVRGLLANMQRSGSNPGLGLELEALFAQVGLVDVVCEQVGEVIELGGNLFTSSPMYGFALQMVPDEQRVQWVAEVAQWSKDPKSRLTLPRCFRAKGRVPDLECL